MDIIYIITDTVTNLKYLGSKKNWKGENTYWGSPNCKNKRYKKFKLQQEWKNNLKQRLNTFKFEVIESYEKISHEKLLEIELFYQHKLNVVKSMEYINAGFAKKGYCGDTMSILSEEGKKARKENISKGLNKFLSTLSKEERLQKFGKKGERNGMFRKKHKKESIQKMKDTKIKNGTNNMPSPFKGKTYEEIFGIEEAKIKKQKISKSSKLMVGEKNPFFGKHHTKKTKKILRQNRLGIKPVNMKKVKINDVEYESLHAASLATGIKYTTLWHRIKSKSEKFKGYNYID